LGPVLVLRLSPGGILGSGQASKPRERHARTAETSPLGQNGCDWVDRVVAPSFSLRAIALV
jgi:hypothetical protein